MLPPPACRPGLAPPQPMATAPAAKPAKGRGGGKWAANHSRNPTDSSTRSVKASKAAAAARGDDSQPMRPVASSSSHTSIPQPPLPPPPTVEEDVAMPTATTSNMFDEMSQSLDDEAFMHATNVANDDYMYASQEYETQYDDGNLDVDDEGFVVKGRSVNNTTAEDVLICTAWKKICQDASVGSDQTVNTYWQRIKEYFDERNTSDHFHSSDSLRQRWSTINAECQKWSGCLSNVARMNPSGCGESDLKMIAQGLFRERNMKGEKKKRKGKAFTFHHCYKEIKDEEKWKTRETFESSKKNSAVLEDEEDVIEETSPTPRPAKKSYRPDGNKKAKGTEAENKDLKEGFDAIVMARKEYAEEKRILKLKEIEERSEAERRRAAAEERLAAAEERKVDLEEKKAAADERKMVEERTL
ncbi:hypothetical protein CFC21_102724 [Triticum aestivum]|uniref:No apical meristem-associated C-terminal domain-containing protein n=2 Tax=Triticum aestivum TaxID=4565 RepID=A0A9R1N5F5_WHEAT|nr:hypothetical protein CFC21_102724 [Triticum aestivum]